MKTKKVICILWFSIGISIAGRLEDLGGFLDPLGEFEAVHKAMKNHDHDPHLSCITEDLVKKSNDFLSGEFYKIFFFYSYYLEQAARIGVSMQSFIDSKEPSDMLYILERWKQRRHDLIYHVLHKKMETFNLEEERKVYRGLLRHNALERTKNIEFYRSESGDL